jgi:Ulp1 family protease
MHEENLAVLRRNEFDIVVEQYGIPISQHDLFTLTGDNWLNDHIIGTAHTPFFLFVSRDLEFFIFYFLSSFFLIHGVSRDLEVFIFCLHFFKFME